MLERVEPNKKDIIYKTKNPFIAKLIKNEKLLNASDSDDARHLVFDISKSNFNYVEGQSVGILAPGLDTKGKNHRARFYSIASCSYGDDGKNISFSLCVKRANTKDNNGLMHFGICSNYLCDLKIGQEVQCVGASGRTLLLPKDENTKLIMLATGTGIAPFRSFLNKIYNHLGSWNGGIDLYFGACLENNAYYMNDINNELLKLNNKKINLNMYSAFSRTQVNYKNKKKYIQHILKDNAKELFDTFKDGNFSLYICGLKGIRDGVDEVCDEYAKQNGLNWNDMKIKFKKQKRWNIEVY